MFSTVSDKSHFAIVFEKTPLFLLSNLHADALKNVRGGTGNRIITIALGEPFYFCFAADRNEGRPRRKLMKFKVNHVGSRNEEKIKQLLLKTYDKVKEDGKTTCKDFIQPYPGFIKKEKIHNTDYSSLTSQMFVELASSLVLSDRSIWIQIKELVRMLKTDSKERQKILSLIEALLKKLLSANNEDVNEVKRRVTCFKEKFFQELISIQGYSTHKSNGTRPRKSKECSIVNEIKDVVERVINELPALQDGSFASGAAQPKAHIRQRANHRLVDADVLPKRYGDLGGNSNAAVRSDSLLASEKRALRSDNVFSCVQVCSFVNSHGSESDSEINACLYERSTGTAEATVLNQQCVSQEHSVRVKKKKKASRWSGKAEPERNSQSKRALNEPQKAVIAGIPKNDDAANRRGAGVAETYLSSSTGLEYSWHETEPDVCCDAFEEAFEEAFETVMCDGEEAAFGKLKCSFQRVEAQERGSRVALYARVLSKMKPMMLGYYKKPESHQLWIDFHESLLSAYRNASTPALD